MSKSRERFINESADLLRSFDCNDHTLEQIQSHLMDIALFLSSNNIKGLDSNFVPAHLLNQYDRFAYEMGNLPEANNVFNQMNDVDLATLRNLCEGLALDLTKQRLQQERLISEKAREQRFIEQTKELFIKHKLSDMLRDELQSLLLDLASFMIENRLEYIELNEWSRKHQQDFERFANHFDSLVDNNPELDLLGDDKLHHLLHLCELYASTEISLSDPSFESLNESYLSSEIKDDIFNYLQKEGVSSEACNHLLSHFERMAGFMQENKVAKAKLEHVPEALQDEFLELLETANEIAIAKHKLSQDKVDRLYRYLNT
jgi:hypothetical protein